MKNIIIYLPFTIVYLSLKSAILPTAPLPDITLLITFYIAYEKGGTSGVIISFLLGYVEDVFNGGIIGISSFSLVFIFAIVSMLKHKIEVTSVRVKIISTLMLSIVKTLITIIILHFKGIESSFLQFLPLIIITAAAASKFFSLFRWINRRTFSYAERKGV